MIVYMIRDRETKNFSGGGMNPFFKKKGKIWSGMAAVKNHIQLSIGLKYVKDTNSLYGLKGHLFINNDFIKYLNSELVITDTESLTSQIDENFVLDYIKEKIQQISKEKEYEITKETKEILCL